MTNTPLTEAFRVDYDGLQFELLIPAEERELDTWQPGVYDAEMTYRGIRFLRYRGGFGDKGDRTDWVADLPVSCHVANHHGRGFAERRPGWGFYGKQTLREALDEAIENAVRAAHHDLGKATRRMVAITAALLKLEES